MTATLYGYQPKHAGGWYDPEHSRLDDYQPRHAAPSDADMLASIARLDADDEHDVCLRCAGVEFAPPVCMACLSEAATVRADMRAELAEFIRTDDGRDSGRAL